MSALYYRRAFSDHHTLNELAHGRIPKFEDWRRRLYLLEHRDMPGQPDHLLKAYRDQRFPATSGSDAQAFGAVVWTALEGLADRFIERRMGRLHIKREHFQDWHQLLPQISPLAVTVAFLVKEGRLTEHQPSGLRAAMVEEIGDSALLTPCDPELDYLVETEGLSDVHLHLNGSTEMDLIWPDAVANPRAFVAGLKDLGAVKDLYENILPDWTAQDLRGVLRAARRVRFVVFENIAATMSGEGQGLSVAHVIRFMASDQADSSCDELWKCVREKMAQPDLSNAPASKCRRSTHRCALIDEALFYYHTLAAAKHKNLSPAAGLGLFYVFSVQRQIIELSVQQLSQSGFEQFQKFADSEVRNRVEFSYEQRFRQLNMRPPYKTIRHFEGRFAPKDSPKKLADLIARIVDGAIRFRAGGKPETPEEIGTMRLHLLRPAPECLLGNGEGAHQEQKSGMQGHPEFELSLVVHFIKKKPTKEEKDRMLDVRRRSLRKEARVLCLVWSRYPLVKQLLRGVDAAANELDSPPEVFAPTYRHMREVGIPHATFHVGEDFRHLIGGMRAVAEAFTFLELGPGDRIGHGTALGIRPSFWLDSAAEHITQTRWESLFDFIFARNTLIEVQAFQATIAQLDERICELSALIFGKAIAPAELNGAVRLRFLDALELPQSLPASWPDIKKTLSSELGTVACRQRQKEIQLILDAGDTHPRSLELHIEILKKMRDNQGFEPYVVPRKILGADALSAMQSNVIGHLNKKNIVIETLPTSNIRISLYARPDQHHLFRWLGIDSRDPLTQHPKICVGSDDPGIFSTNILLEFALIKDILEKSYILPKKEATAIIQDLFRTARAHRFRPCQNGPATPRLHK